MAVLADLPAFLADHRSHGTLTGGATNATPRGYMVEVACECGVVFMRWVTPDDATLELLQTRVSGMLARRN